MPSLDKPCLLLPHLSKRSTVYVCVPVDTSIATRSPVLETLMEFDGPVEMPGGVSVDDFEAWAALSTDDPSALDESELCLARKVPIVIRLVVNLRSCSLWRSNHSRCGHVGRRQAGSQ